MSERADKIAQATELRAQGLSYKRIAPELGVSAATVYRWLNPDYAERSRQTARAWKARNRNHIRQYDAEYYATHKGTCSSCGGAMSYQNDGGTCAACRYDEYDRKARKVVRLWSEGKSFPEIQVAMGWSKGMLSRMMQRYRADGYDLPYRYRNGTKYPELAA